MLKMLQDNRGVHEPQEERVFQNIISYLPKKCTMIELGAYWAFYSLSLLQERPSAKCYLIEPDARNLMSGRINFRCNQRRGVFVQAFVGAQECSEPRTIAVDSFMAQRRIKHVNILHADIQGAEYEMLLGAEKSLQLRLIDFIFISTHSASLHEACRQRLGDYGYIILADINLSEAHSYDGLLVAKAPIPNQ
jgi:hypothetical protein